MTVIPAYGRDYKSRAAVLADLKAGKDFIGVKFGERDRSINLATWLAMGEEVLSARFWSNRKIALFKRSELE